jgi:hypothetical protein
MAGTVPKPLLIETFVEPVTFQRRTADCPRSMEEGSTENSAITGTPGPGGAFRVGGSLATGAGGGGIGVCLLHAASKTIAVNAQRRTFGLEGWAIQAGNRDGE